MLLRPLLARGVLAAASALPLACAAAPATLNPDAGAHHVVVVTVDGLRPDAITEADTPQLARLVREGAASLASRVPHPPETLPAHFSMATGQTPSKHGIVRNKWLDPLPPNPTLFTAAHGAGRRTALYFGKSKLVALAPRGSADVLLGPGKGESDWKSGADGALAARFAQDFPRLRFGLAWVHLRAPDMAGHDAGWMTAAYRRELRVADEALGVVRKAIADSGLPTTLIVTADHGGEGKEHWGQAPADSVVPWICAGPGIKPGARLAESSVTDVGPTAAALLGVKLPDVEGRVVSECLP